MSADNPNSAFDLDAMRVVWQEHDAKLDAILRLNTAQVRQHIVRRVRTRLERLSWWLGVELLVLLPFAVSLALFAYHHRQAMRFVLPAVLLLVCAIGLVAASVRQLAALAHLQLDGGVIAMQTALERLRLERLRAMLGALVLGPLVWLPMLIVVARGGLGVDVYAVTTGAWIATNLALGALVVVAAMWGAQRLRGRRGASPRLQRMLDHLSGAAVAEARRFLDDLAALDAHPSK